MNGEKIANLIIEWANIKRIHPENLDELFVYELIKMLYADKGE